MFKKNPNRNSGKWLRNREGCPQIAQPCGNPIDADEAMRAGQISAGSNDYLAQLQADQAMAHALDIASNCQIPQGSCPLEIQFSTNRKLALEKLKAIVR